MVVELCEKLVFRLGADVRVLDKGVAHVVGCHTVHQEFLVGKVLLRSSFRFIHFVLEADEVPESIRDNGFHVLEPDEAVHFVSGPVNFRLLLAVLSGASIFGLLLESDRLNHIALHTGSNTYVGVSYQNASETELYFLGQSRVRVIIVGGWFGFRNDVSLFLFVLGQFCAGDVIAVLAELVVVKFLV